ncbi:MAG: DUF7718 family protein [Halobacteriota archaeon]
MKDRPREYDREYTTRAGTVVRRRLGYTHDHGEVTRFVVQLEYLYQGEWTPVVRYDHDPASVHGHDAAEEGLHIDVYRDGEPYRREYVAPPMPASVALDFAEDHLTENTQRFIRRFEAWHENRHQ